MLISYKININIHNYEFSRLIKKQYSPYSAGLANLRFDIFLITLFDVQDNNIVGHVFRCINIQTIQLHESL